MKFLFQILILICFHSMTYSQKAGINTIDPKSTLDVNGKIKIENEFVPIPQPGMMRYNNADARFQGHNGNSWQDLNINPINTFWPTYGNRGAIGSYNEYSPDDANPSDYFGHSVDMDGQYAVVGSPGWDGNRGRVFVMKRDPYLHIWNPIDTLYGKPGSTEWFGFDVALDSNLIIVGAPYNSDQFANSGRVVVYKLNITNSKWDSIYTDYLGVCASNYGYSVEVERGKLVASATNPNCPNNNGLNSVKIFDQTGQSFYILSGDPTYTVNNKYGYDLSMDSVYLAISAPQSDQPGNTSAFTRIYKQVGNTTAYLLYQHLAPTLVYDNFFGGSIGLNKNHLIIGAEKTDGAPNDNRGKLHLHYFNSTTGLYQEQVLVLGAYPNGKLGHAVCATNSIMIATGYEDPTGSRTEIKVFKNIEGRFQQYVSIPDPQATNADDIIEDIAAHNNSFIIGLPYGESFNGKLGGRVFFGRVR